MQIRIACQCGRVIEAEAASAGSHTRCPACGRALAVPAAPQEPAVFETPPAPVPLTAVAPPPVIAKRYKGLAIASMVLGLSSCVPCFALACGLLGVVAGLTAIGLGIPSVIGKTDGRGFGITGLACGAVGILISLLPLGLIGLGPMLGGRLAPRPTPGPPPTAAKQSKEPAPPVLTGDEVAEALTGPLKGIVEPARAAGELSKALAAYLRRDAGPRHLHECVLSFRLHLAHAGKERLDDPAHQRMLKQAGDELVKQVLAKYREAGELQQDRRWAEAARAYGQLLTWLSGPDSAVQRNVKKHQEYCWRRRQGGGEAEE